ncbi:MAG: transglycosylase family protein [Solirubrobacterales bacterium]
MPDPRLRRRRLALGLTVAAVIAVPLGIGLAAAAPSLDEQLESAGSEADRLSGRIDSQTAEIAELQERARAAGLREMELNAEAERSLARSRELAGELGVAKRRLERVRADYKQAVGALSGRLVEIYKDTEPDNLTLLLDSNGYEDLSTRAEYLSAIHDADSELADRVASLQERVEGDYERIAGLKAEMDQQAATLEGARAEMAGARAEAESSAVKLADARGAAQSDLGEIESRIAELEAEQAEQQSSGSEFHGGPYAIPTYIVMCESGGNYRAYNPSSGAGGAYQIIPSTWRAYGGQGLAHQAPKAEQDRIAAMIWRDSGPGAWSCA